MVPVLLADHSGAVAAATTLSEERIGLLRRIRVGTFGDRRLGNGSAVKRINAMTLSLNMSKYFE